MVNMSSIFDKICSNMAEQEKKRRFIEDIDPIEAKEILWN